MLHVLLSPAKKIDFKKVDFKIEASQPVFLKETKELVKKLKNLSSKELQNLMGISSALGDLNHKRYQEFETPFTSDNSKPAAYAFIGDTYIGLEFDKFQSADIKRAQKQIHILSGLYGLLSPLDLIQPYRLEMGTRWKLDSKHANLYSYWKPRLTKHLQTHVNKSDVLVNLASQEYSQAIDFEALERKIITPIFKEKSKTGLKVIGLRSKRARGAMAAYIIKSKIQKLSDLKSFTGDRYIYSEQESNDQEWVFIEK